MIDEAEVRVVEPFNQGSLRCFFILVPRSLWIRLVEKVWSSTSSINSAEQTIPPQKSIVSCKAAKLDWIDIFVKGFVAEIIFSFSWLLFLGLTAGVLGLFCELTNFLLLLPHVLLHRTLTNKVKLQHGLLDTDRVFGS
jgi:hypothetical protein